MPQIDSADGNEQPTAKKPNFRLPDDFDNEGAFLNAMRKDFHDDIQFDRLNREAALEDTRFVVGDQWDDIVRQRREAGRKPVLTINRMPAFVAQIVGTRRINETQLKVYPDNAGTVEIAKIREGLMRSIQKISRAEIAYDTALMQCVICGIGQFQVMLEYEDADVWNQRITLRQLPDPQAVIWDRELIDPTGADAKHVFVVDTMRKNDYVKKYPWATPADMVVDVTLRGDLRMNGWIAIDDVRIVEYWRMMTRKRTLALLTNGKTVDITDVSDPQTLSGIMQRSDGTPIIREVDMKFAQMYKCSGLDILEGPHEWPISRVPVLRVPGWEVFVGQWKHRWGLVRFLKDPQRFHNLARSVIAERMMQTPRAVWLAADNAVAGREKDYRESNMSDDPLLRYNASAGSKPERLNPPQLEEAWLGQAELANQDIKDVSNIHEANLGMPSNETSGAAINARQRVSDVGTVLYHDNLNMAIEQAGVIIDQLIPHVYDATRTIKVLGDDGKQELQQINDPNNPQTDITEGKYSVTIQTGPSTATKRIEAAEHMMTLVNAMPQVAAIIADLIVVNQDWPGADEIARRLRTTLPPGLLDPKDMSPEQQQAAQQQQETAQKQQDMQMKGVLLDWLEKQSIIGLNEARARNFNADADAAPAKLANEQISTASQAAERELSGQLSAIKLAHTGA